MANEFKIGHYTDEKNITGCSVILCPHNTIASCYISGSAPGSREIALLDPVRKVISIHALFLTGGSAFGLNAAAGVVQFLEEKEIGYKTHFGIIPIVPGAVIYDLNIGSSKVRPIAENAYQACQEARPVFTQMGSIGAGTGATVGKWSGIANAMKGGLGIATLSIDDIFVTAVSVVNSVGDIIDEKGKVIAGAIDRKGNLIGEGDISKRWHPPSVGFSENTILIAIITNAKLNKIEANKISRRAQNGLARAVIPASTSYDGDIIFTLACGQKDYDLDLISEIAAEAVRRSILAGVNNADSLGNFPSVETLKEK